MIKIETKEGLRVSWEDSRITLDNCGNLIEELNSWLNNGYKLVKIKDGTYFLDEDEAQLALVEYESKDGKDTEYYYCQIMTQAQAFCIRQYFGAVLDDGNGNEIFIDEDFVKIIDLRGRSSEYIESIRDRKPFTDDFDLLELVLEDLSYA